MSRYILSSALLLSCILSHAQTFDQCAAELSSKKRGIDIAAANQKTEDKKMESILRALQADFDKCILGSELPGFNLTSIRGNTYTNERLLGKVVYINIWTISCGACWGEISVLNNIEETYRDSRDVVFISLLLDKPEELDKFLKQHKLQEKIDFDLVATRTPFGTTNLRNILPQPTHLFIDRNGKISKKFEGVLPDSQKEEESLKSAISELLAQ
jgi:peroxiredoxin